MDPSAPIRYSDLIQPDNSIKELEQQLKDLANQYKVVMDGIKAQANSVKASLDSLSGATTQGQQAIKNASSIVDKLAKKEIELAQSTSEVAKQLAQKSAQVRYNNNMMKLQNQLANSAAGSYNALSAQYGILKLRLNAMGAEERKTTQEGQALEKEAANLMAQMKQLQEATGKHTLNVGNYADAAKGLRSELMSLVQQMAMMKVEGQTNSEEYRNMASRAAELKDAMMDANAEIKNMASDTNQLDATMGAASAASGGMTAVTGTMALMGQTSETASDAQKNLGAAVGIVSGLTVVQNQLQKESNIMTGIRVLQTKAATKAEQLDAAAKAKGTAVTKAATVAQRIFNAVAAANPYVLLAIALITVVGALIAFSAGANRAAREQDKLNKAIAAELDYLEKVAEETVRVNNERIRAMQAELEIARANNATQEQTRALEDRIHRERVAAHDKLMGMYGDEVSALESNRAKLKTLRQTLLELQKAQAAGRNRIRVDVDLDGKMERTKIDKAIEAVQGQIDNLGRSVEIAVDLKTEGEDLAKERAVQLAQRIAENRAAAKTERGILRESLDARLAIIGDGYDRERALLKEAARRQIEDLRTRMAEETNLTARARQAMFEQIKAIRAKEERDLEDLRNVYAARDIAARRETEDVELNIMAEGAYKQRVLLRTQYQRRIEDLQTALATQLDLTDTEVQEINNRLILAGEEYRKELAELDGRISAERLSSEISGIQLRLDAAREGSQEQIDLTRELLEKQRALELAQNAQAAEDVRQNEADIHRKWDEAILRQTAELVSKRAMMILDGQQALSEAEFAMLDRNERQKALFQIRMEKQRLQELLRLDAEAGYLMEANARKAMEKTVEGLDKEAKRLPYNNLYELLGIGLDSDQQGALNTAIDSVKNSIASLVDSWNAAAEAALNAANAQVDAAQKTLDAEIEARNAGYANEVATAQKELELAKKNQDAAIKEKQKAQKAQLAIDTITQASSLITASANIWSSLSGVPVVGPALAAAALVTMWGSFALAKVKAAQVAGQTEQYGQGTVELLQGGSHASGHDIDLGTKPDGTRRRAEGGEYFAVINKRNSRKYRDVIPDVIRSLNNGTFAQRYMRAYDNLGNFAFAATQGSSTDVSKLERDVQAIKKQNDTRVYTDAQGNTVIVYKNLTRKLKS